ncbi:MAG: hypothetical protein IKF01_04100 [Bacilli bacterium]|nr:hypothetical protein [Bacilli bacterium]
MKDKIEMIITMLETEKTLLQLKKEKNNAEMWKCDLLINYYMEIRQEMFIRLNRKRNDLNEYNSILSLLEKIPSKLLDKLESFISENNYLEKVIDTEQEILEIEEKDSDIKNTIIQIKKRKKQLIDKNANIEKKLILIDEKLDQPIDMIDEITINNKLLHKKTKHK